jgi:hypothetical protein
MAGKLFNIYPYFRNDDYVATSLAGRHLDVPGSGEFGLKKIVEYQAQDLESI